MFTVKRNGENRVDMMLDGKLTADDMKVALDELLIAAEGVENGSMLYDIVNFHIPSFAAIGVELSRLPSMFKLIKQFKRVAVLTDKNWLQKASEIEGALFPGLDIKAFNRDQLTEAEAWLKA